MTAVNKSSSGASAVPKSLWRVATVKKHVLPMDTATGQTSSDLNPRDTIALNGSTSARTSSKCRPASDDCNLVMAPVLPQLCSDMHPPSKISSNAVPTEDGDSIPTHRTDDPV